MYNYIASFFGGGGGTTPAVEESDTETLGQQQQAMDDMSGELRGETQSQSSGGQSDELQRAELSTLIDQCNALAEQTISGRAGPDYKSLRNQLKGLNQRKGKKKLDVVAELLKAGTLKATLEEELIDIPIREAAAKKQADQEEAQRANAPITPTVETEEVQTKPDPVFTKPPIVKDEAPQRWQDHLTNESKLVEWELFAATDAKGKGILDEIKKQAKLIISTTGRSGKKKRQVAGRAVRSNEDKLVDRIDEAEVERVEALVKPTLPSHVKEYGWNEFTGFRYPSGGLLKLDEGMDATLDAAAMKHPEDELGPNPSEERVTAYFTKLSSAAKVFATGVKKGTYVQESPVWVNGWRFIGVKIHDGKAVKIYHADSLYENSPWRDHAYRG